MYHALRVPSYGDSVFTTQLFDGTVTFTLPAVGMK